MKKIPAFLAIPTPQGQDIVPMTSIAIIRENDATDTEGVRYQIKLINGNEDTYDFTIRNGHTAKWKTEANLSIYRQLHPEEFQK